MTCNQCVSSVRKSLEKLDGIGDIDIDLVSGHLIYSSSSNIDKKVQEIILSLGYKIKNQ